MDLGIFTEPQQGATYGDLLRVARAAEDAGHDAFFRSDHYRSMGGMSGEPGPTDAWTTLSALAVHTSRIRLGTLATRPRHLAGARRDTRSYLHVLDLADLDAIELVASAVAPQLG